MSLWLQKLFWMAFQPSSLIAIALALSVSAHFRLHPRAARRWAAIALALLLVLGLSPLSDILIAPLENRFPRPDLTGTRIDGVVVLGGSEDTNVAGSRGIVGMNDAGERIVETAILARLHPNARIVVVGGSDPTAAAVEPEAVSSARVLEALGVAPDRLSLETRSRTTWENGVLAQAVIAMKPGERWLLVTSAWQMPRAMGVFRTLGMELIAFPVDYRTGPSPRLLRLHSAISDGLHRFDRVIREYPGLLFYRLMGRTNTLFPGPAP